MKPTDLACYMLLALLWGFSFMVILKVIQAFGWMGAVTFRSLVAGLTLLAAARLTGRGLDFSIGWRPFAIVGATTVALQLAGLTVAAPRIGTAMAAIFVATIPLFTMLISHVWGIERISGQRAAGMGLGFGGIVLLVGFPAVPVTGSFALGCAASLCSSLAAAYGSNYASMRLRDAGPWESTIGSFLAGGLMTLPLMLAVPVPASPQLMDLFWLLVLGGAMSGLAYILFFRLVASIGPTKTISVEFVVTVIAVLVGTLLLGERLSTAQLAGAAVIVAGCALVLGLTPARKTVKKH